MRVIPEPAEGSREVVVARNAGSVAITDTEGSVSFLCGNCRDIPQSASALTGGLCYTYDDGTEQFIPLYRVRDLVFKCKGCGAFNEVAD
jgi:hypothetical protein